MTDDLVKRLSRIGERVAVPCPDNIKGCLVFHFRIETDPVCQEAIDRIETLEKALEKHAAFIVKQDLWEVFLAALGEKKDGEAI